jgi:hypothetical protein
VSRAATGSYAYEMVNRFEIRYETVYEAQRLNEVLKLQRRESLFCASFHPASLGMMAQFFLIRIFGLSIQLSAYITNSAATGSG